MQFQITALYAAPLAVLVRSMSRGCVRHCASLSGRRINRPCMNSCVATAISSNGSFVLIVMALANAQGTTAPWMHAAGALLLASRALQPDLKGYQPFQAAFAEVLRRAGYTDAANAAYDRAIALSGNAPERAFLRSREARAKKKAEQKARPKSNREVETSKRNSSPASD